MSDVSRRPPIRTSIRALMVATAVFAALSWAYRTFSLGEFLGVLAMLFACGLHFGFVLIRVQSMEDDALR